MIGGAEYSHQRYVEGRGDMHRTGIVGDKEIAAPDQRHQFSHTGFTGQVKAVVFEMLFNIGGNVGLTRSAEDDDPGPPLQGQ